MASDNAVEVSLYRRILTSNITLRFLVAVLLVFMCLVRIGVTYPGLDQPVAMDQAQIARELANGNGFTTKFLRPKSLENASGPKHDRVLDLDHFKDTNYAPLNICAMAAALRMTGYHDFEACRMHGNKKNPAAQQTGGQGEQAAEEDDSYLSLVYDGDRVISGVSMFFFFISVVLVYLLGKRMFDELVGACTATFMVLNQLMLDYATSGLPQMLMLACFLGSLHFIFNAAAYDNGHNPTKVLLHMVAAYFFITLLCLTGWMGIWCALGLIVFSSMVFRPFGAYAIPGIVIVGIGIMFSIGGNTAASGTLLGDAYYSLYDGLGSASTTAEDVLRSTGSDNQDMEKANFVVRILGYACSQFSGIYSNMGAIVVAPFFLLALLNRYKRHEVEGVKWATFSMWCFACLGMALYGIDTPFNPSQLGIIFAPVFTLFGVTLVFNFIARFKLSRGQFALARGLTMCFMICVSSGPMLAALPGDIWDGIRLRALINQEPTYVPPALNINLADATDADSIIMTDQPWAVAWYANRKALWLPRKASSYEEVLRPIIENAQVCIDQQSGKMVQPHVQGIVLTSISRSPLIKDISLSRRKRDRGAIMGGFVEVYRQAGSFWGLAQVDGRSTNGKTMVGIPTDPAIAADKTITIRDLWRGNIVFFDFGKRPAPAK